MAGNDQAFHRQNETVRNRTWKEKLPYQELFYIQVWPLFYQRNWNIIRVKDSAIKSKNNSHKKKAVLGQPEDLCLDNI